MAAGGFWWTSLVPLITTGVMRRTAAGRSDPKPGANLVPDGAPDWRQISVRIASELNYYY